MPISWYIADIESTSKNRRSRSEKKSVNGLTIQVVWPPKRRYVRLASAAAVSHWASSWLELQRRDSLLISRDAGAESRSW